MWNRVRKRDAAQFIHQFMHGEETDNNNINNLDIPHNLAPHNNQPFIHMHPSIVDCNLDDFRRTCTTLFDEDPLVMEKFLQVIDTYFYLFFR